MSYGNSDLLVDRNHSPAVGQNNLSFKKLREDLLPLKNRFPSSEDSPDPLRGFPGSSFDDKSSNYGKPLS